MSDERDKIDRQIAEEVREIFFDGAVVQWARDACANLPSEAKAWDRNGGRWLCIFRKPADFTDDQRWLAMLTPFHGDELLLSGVGFELETEADLAGWAWTRMLHKKFNLLAFERDPMGAQMPVYVRAEWFPGGASEIVDADFGKHA